MTFGKEEYSLIRTSGGIALEYEDLIETDFAAANGAAYTPPDNSAVFRRINVARTIQILSECPGVIETFQTSAATIHLPANDVSDITNDAGNGRFFIFKNSGTGTITIKDYQANLLFSLPAGLAIQALSNTNNQWDFLFVARNTIFDNSTNGFVANNVQDAIEELADQAAVSASPGFTFGKQGNCPTNTWLLCDGAVPSNEAGRAIYLNNATLEVVFVRCKVTETFTLGIYEHDGTTYTLKHTTTITAARFKDDVIAAPVALTTGKELAVKIDSGSVGSPIVGLQLKGNIP